VSTTIDPSTLTPSQRDALKQVLALRRLSSQLGIRTTRTQNSILQALSDSDLIAVANVLAQMEQSGGAK
jgi:hypothetical protein